MNRKDFELLARTFRYLPQHGPDQLEGLYLDVVARTAMRDAMARYFANAIDTNCAGFDRAKFLQQCGVTS